MKFKEKQIKVVFVGNAKTEYERLTQEVKLELKNGKDGTEKQKLLKSINRIVGVLKINPSYGIQIPKDRIPKKYIVNFDVRNLWKCNLFNFWRLIYTIEQDENEETKEIEIINFVLEFMNHKKYNKRFEYRKN